MAWTTPITSNSPATKVTVTTFDNIGANQVYLKERADTVDDRLGQSVNPADSPTFENVSLSGMTGTVEGRIETNTSDIATNATNISSNDGDISTLQGNRVVIGSNASLNSVTTDNVAIKHKEFSGTLSVLGTTIIAHELTQSNIRGISVITGSEDIVSNTNISITSTSIILGGTGELLPYTCLVTYKA